MNKIELLSPAGNIESLKMAVKCGADAVYISGKEHGARKYAENFTIDEIEEAIKYCHLYGVKLYITVNTLIDETDIKSVIDYIRTLHKIGIDAIIMQDIGLIKYIKKKFPNLEIHASTQTHNCNKESIKFLTTLGVQRVVLARELTQDEIKQIKESTNTELEVFIHGALCVCYSGQCLISSKLFGRSGNKGMCAQLCRFKYDLYKNKENQNLDNEYLLSMKELCTKDTIKELIETGVSSLKIEGRMKSKYYVGYVTKFYRMLIDKYYNHEEMTFKDEELKNLLKLYNREFTTGFLNNDKEIVNPKTCNHQGTYLGEVLEIKDKIKIKLKDDINQEDGIRFGNNEGMICNFIYNEKGLLINKASKGQIIYLDNKVNLTKKCPIYKTQDIKLNKEIENIEERKVKVDFEVEAKLNKPLSITIICGQDKITKTSEIIEKSKTNPTTQEVIIEKLSKLGNTPFKVNNINIDYQENIFIPVKNINKLRQELTEELIILRQKNNIEFIEKEIEYETKTENLTNEISFLVRNELQLKKLLNKNVVIYTESINLYEKYKDNNKVYYRPPRAGFEIKDKQDMLITNNGYLNKNEQYQVSDIYMNAYNSLTIETFSNYVNKIGISPELKLENIKNVIESYKEKYNSYPNVEVLIYGKLELMLMKYCPIKYLTNENEKCIACINNKFYLDDKKGNKFRLLKDETHTIRVLDYENINLLNEINYLKQIKVTNFRIDLLDENEDEIEKILEKLSI